MASKDEEIVIEIELDDSQVKKKFKDIERDADKTAKSIENSFSSKMNKPIDTLNIKIDNLRSNLLNFLEVTERLINIGSVLGPLLLILAKRFSFIDKIVDKLDKRFKRVVLAVRDFINLFIEFIRSPTLKTLKNLVPPLVEMARAFGIADDIIKTLISNMSRFGVSIRDVAHIILLLIPFQKVFKKIGISITAVSAATILVVRDLRGLLKILPNIGRFLGNSTRSLFGLTSALAGTGILLTTFGATLKESTNNTVKFSGVAIATLGLALTGMSALVGFAILKFAELAQVIGTKLVAVFRNATNEFIQLEKSMVIFNKTIENYNSLSHGAVGSTESWTKAVEDLSNQFNVSRNELRKSANEIVAVTSKLGLNEKQMKSLLKVSTEYAKINGKDLFQTTVNLVSALNGNGQAVQALGIKMNQAANTTFALKQGLDRSFASLSQNSKVAVRFNSLMKQYAGIVGIAAASTNTLAEQGAKLKINQERLNESLGAGAAIIENNQLVAFALNKVINNVSDTVLKITGFFGAFGARLLQIGGFVLGLSFKLFALFKVLKIIDIVLRNDATQSLFGRSIPLLGKSINTLVQDLIGAKVQIKSVGDIMKISGKAIPLALNNISKALFGVSKASLTFSGAISGGFKTIIKSAGSLITFLRPLLAVLLPVAATIALVVAAFLALKKAMEEIEERTSAFTELYSIITDALNDSESIFSSLVIAVKSFGKAILDVADVALGLLVTSIVGLVRILTELAVSNPFNVFSKQTIARLTDVNKKLDGLTASLTRTGFSIVALGEDGSRSIASLGKTIKDVNVNELQRLVKVIGDVGKTDLQKLARDRDDRLRLITSAFEQDLLLEAEFESLKLKIREDFAVKGNNLLKGIGTTSLQELILDRDVRLSIIKEGLQQQLITLLEFKQKEAKILADFDLRRKDILLKSQSSLKQLNNNINKSIISSLAGGVSSAFKAFGRALAQGENALEAFGQSALNSLGGFMVQLGEMIILAGIATTSLGISLESFNGAGAIAAGAALVVLGSAIQSLSGGPAALGSQANPATVAPPQEDAINIDPDLPERQTAITINVEGTILDPVSTATQIAELLSEVTDSNDILVNA